MNCPSCTQADTTIIERRDNRRRRECRQCGHRWTTYEIPAETLARYQALERHATAMAEEIKDTGTTA